VTSFSEQPTPLPARRRRTRRSGRHRGEGAFAIPPDSPALVLAAPGRSGVPGTLAIAELAELARAAHPGLPVHVAHLDDLGAVLTGLNPDLSDGMPAAVVVPQTTGPNPQVDTALRAVVDAVHSDDWPIVLAEPLGPHPLIAEALHVRLAEAGLARADRVRLLTMVTAADGILLATTGGEAAAQEIEINCVLLASRLAVPVVPVSLDDGPAAGEVARRLKATGTTRLAMAPCFIGPEADPEQLLGIAAETGAASAQPLGAHPALVELTALRYAEALEKVLTD
jgi:sirohydrochlorin ferrochelatase